MPAKIAANSTRTCLVWLDYRPPSRNAVDGAGLRARLRLEKSGARRLVVSLVVFRRTPVDDDNLSGGLKWLRDAIARSLGIDDGDRRVRFEYAQLATTGREGTAVKIERV